MTAEIAERVARLALWDRHFPTAENRVIRLREVVRFESGAGATRAWLVGLKRPVTVGDTLDGLEKELAGLFVRTHRFHLVAAGRVAAVFRRYADEGPAREDRRGAADECELEIAGSAGRVPVSENYADGVRKALGLRSLQHPVPEHPDDKRLRELGITDFGWRERYKLDPKNAAAVEAYIAAWKIVWFGFERTMTYFRQAGAKVIDKRRLAKSIIWQNWSWIRKGIQKKFTGNIRTFWYTVKNALGGDEIMAPDDVDVFYDALRELIEDHRLFRYKDFGFMDMKALFHGVGERHPGAVLVFEKAGQAEDAKLLAAEAGSSFICLGGEPSLLTLEYFTDNLKAAIGDKPISVFIMTDINPAGVSIRNNFLQGMRNQGMAFERVEILWDLKDLTGATLPGGKAQVVRFERRGGQLIPIKPASKSSLRKALNWFESVGDPRLMTEQQYPGKLVVTIWGIDSDTADKALVRRRFLTGVGEWPGRKRR